MHLDVEERHQHLPDLLFRLFTLGVNRVTGVTRHCTELPTLNLTLDRTILTLTLNLGLTLNRNPNPNPNANPDPNLGQIRGQQRVQLRNPKP